jgi:RNA polymerase sigma-70 factor (ECF subfamily)
MGRLDPEMIADHELLAAWRAGDQLAGAELLQRHGATLYRFFANKVPSGVEDLAQRVFLGCVEARDRIDETRSFRAYLLGIARNVLYQHFRTVRTELRAGALQLACAEDIVGSPSRVVAFRHERRLLLDSLRRIPLEQQLVLELHYWEGLSVAEIAEVVGVGSSGVKSRLSRARAALRERIAGGDAPAEIRDSTLSELQRWVRSVRDALDPPDAD